MEKANKKNKQKNKRWVSSFGLKVLLLAIAGIIISHQFKPTTESQRSEMKKIPADVRNTMGKNSPEASISATIRVPILLYHYVEYVQDKRDTIRQSLNVNPNVFEKQLQTLQGAGYNFINAQELREILDGKLSLPRKPILLTFDDGHWDLDTVVLPLLKKYHVKATAYIVTSFLGGSDSLSQKQLQDVIDSGLIEIGAHTVHHISLKGKLLPVVKYEVSQSKAILEQAYHIHVVSFAYPNGTFDNQAIATVKEAGYTNAVSTIPGIAQSEQNQFFLYRLRPGYRTGQLLLDYLQNAFKT